MHEVEEIEDGDPRGLVIENALRKARAVHGELVLGVDTTVVVDGRSYGKPADRDHPTQVYDIHATVLHLLGIDHERLTFRHNGIDRRLTDVHGRVIREVLA